MYTFIAKCILCAIVSTVLYIKWKFSYWSRKKFPFVKAISPIFGSYENPIFSNENFGFQLKRYYDKARRSGQKYFGIYLLWKPFCVAIDRQFIKSVLIKDFDQFSDRGCFYNEEDDPMTANIVNLDVHKWRPLRFKLAPTFSSAKIKTMLYTVLKCGKQLKQAMDKKVVSGSTVKIKDALSNFTINVMGSCAFGLDCNAFEDTDSDFARHVKKIFAPSKFDLLKTMFATCFPNLAKTLRMRILNREMAKFFTGVIRDTIEYRETNRVVRNDFLHLLIQLKNDEMLVDKDGTKLHNLTFNQIVAQCFIIFAAGYETSSSAATLALYEIAVNQDMQQRLREEIFEKVNNYDNQLTYECLNEMKYMDQVLDETLRKYPPIFFVVRKSLSNYTIPGTQQCIDQGSSVIVPILALHHDPEYFPNPEKFDPDRFSDKNKQNMIPYSYLPFSEGPRNCIGIRLGRMQVKVALAILLQNFSFSLNAKTQLPLLMDPWAFVYTIKGDVCLNINRLEG